MAASTVTDARVSAEMIATCRLQFCAGRDIDEVSAALGLELETVRRIHDVHSGKLRPHVKETLRGRDKPRKDRSSAGRQAERLARQELAVRLVESGFGVELAVELSGAEMAAVASACQQRRRS